MNRLPVLERTYDFIKWLVPAVTQFPRQQRYLLGERLESAALELLDFLVEAQASPPTRQDALLKAGVRVDRLACLLRLSHDLMLLSPRRYEHGARVVAEVGAQVGAWRKRGSGQPAGRVAAP
ncbi:MAG: diversity-generating retroelement protein Avd [Armatimonadetes bacterium]|nr:diversity-generating retroelement protein Avd [Armatimonadota bacterium]